MLPPEFHEISFLRCNAVQLRNVVCDKPPPVAQYLCRIAQDWDARADELEAAAGNQRTR
jgi:hypothetical protein